MTEFKRFGVIGGGAWGTALAAALVRAGQDTLLWARDADVVDSINQRHVNNPYLPAVPLDASLKATGDFADIKGCDAWLWVVPVQYSRAVAKELAAVGASTSIPIIECSKGIELDTQKLPAAILGETLEGHPLSVLSGPSFAKEVGLGMPTAVTLACEDEALGMALCQAISSPEFRPYYSPDLAGAQIGGAIKNVLAIATGIAAGSQMGDNARAALITRGLAEMLRLGAALGAQTETLMGLSGMGDLVLTCSSLQSRNMSLGYELGEGRSLEQVMAGRNSVAEGVPTTRAARALAQSLGVDMPIVEAVNAILNKGENVKDVISALLARPLKAEVG